MKNGGRPVGDRYRRPQRLSTARRRNISTGSLNQDGGVLVGAEAARNMANAQTVADAAATATPPDASDNLDAYIPGDRRRALATGIAMPPRVRGAALFADIS